MNITIDKNSIKPVYQQLRDALAGAIRSGELSIGSRIMSENALSKKCGIHRHTARNSLQLLSEEGLITSIPGRGWFVTAPPSDKASGAPSEPAPSGALDAGTVIGVVYGEPLHTIRSCFAASFLNYLLDAGRSHNYDVRFLSDDDIHEMKNREECGTSPDVVIWVMPPPESIPEIEELYAAGRTVIVANRHLYGSGVPFITVNQYSGARELISRLINAGHRRIGCVTSDMPYRYVSERWRGFSDAMHAAGIEPDEKLVLHVTDPTDIRAGLKQLFEGNPDMTALFLAGETFHRQTFEYIADAGIRIPEDISVVVFDAVQINGLPRKIIAAEQPTEQISEQLFAMAARLLGNAGARDGENGIVIEPVICSGESIRKIN